MGGTCEICKEDFCQDCKPENSAYPADGLEAGGTYYNEWACLTCVEMRKTMDAEDKAWANNPEITDFNRRP